MKIEESHKPIYFYIENESFKYKRVKIFIEKSKIKKENIILIDDIKEVIENYKSFPYPQDELANKYFVIGKQKSNFIKHCPCSKGTLSCGYYFINAALGCPIECTYCFLQGFLNTSFPVFYINFEDLDNELKEISLKKNNIRLGTGEMTDSLVFEPLNYFGRELAIIFKKYPNLILELKTKSIFIDSLLDLDIPNVVLSWSLNPNFIASIEEKHAPPPEERIKASYKAQENGFSVGFHFDPIIAYPDWEDLYYDLLKFMFNILNPYKISWISLGTFRIAPQLRDLIKKNYPNSRVLLNELIIGYDGKYRYFIKDRIYIYKKMLNWIKELSKNKNICVYLCMESKEVWKEVNIPYPKKWYY